MRIRHLPIGLFVTIAVLASMTTTAAASHDGSDCTIYDNGGTEWQSGAEAHSQAECDALAASLDVNGAGWSGVYTAPPPTTGPASPTTLSYTGSVQLWTVPAGLTLLYVDVAGAEGMNNSGSGRGGRVTAAVPVTPGEVLRVRVGGAPATSVGGYNGGGNGGSSASAGGGASDIYRGGTPLVVAGGGGGGATNFNGGGAAGGAGGGLVGGLGTIGPWSNDSGAPGAGGSQTAGGAAGKGSGSTGSSGVGYGQDGVSGSRGQGGNGGGGWTGGGGGGGGYYGGGGGGGSYSFFGGMGGGGGGGSSYADFSGSVIHSQDVRVGNGEVRLSATPLVNSYVVQQPLVGGSLSASRTFGGGNGFNRYCEECTTRNQAGHPIDTGSGNFWETVTDLAIPGRGVSLLLSRTYNSRAASVDGLFGFGWSWTYGMNLKISSRETGTNLPLAVTVNLENGATATFSRSSSSGGFSAPPWVGGSLSHDSANDTYTVERRAKETLTFDGTGRLIGIRDWNGYMTSLTWSSTSLVVTEPAPGSRQLAFGLFTDASGRSRVSQVTDPAGRKVTYRYDTAGNLTDVFDITGPVPPSYPVPPSFLPDKGHTGLGYQNPSGHLLTTMRRPRFANDTTTVPAPVLTNVYDTASPPRVLEQSNALGQKTTFNYDGDPAFPGSTIVTHPDNYVPDSNRPTGGKKTLDQYQYGVLVTHIEGYGTPEASTWRYVHDPVSLGLTRTEAPNGISEAMYDGRGNRLWSRDPLGRSIEATFNGFNQPLSVKDARGTTTTFTYDQNNTGPNLISIAKPLNSTQTATTTFFYGERGSTNPGEVTSMVDPEHQPATATSLRWKYDYDVYGQRTTVTDPLEHSAAQDFDIVGRRNSSTNGKLKTTLYEFDPDGLVTRVTDPLGHFSRRTYDADRNPNFSADAKGNETTVEFDPVGQAKTVTRPPAVPGASPTYLHNDYWPDGSLKEQRDGAGAPTRSGYDSQGRLSSETDPLNRVTRYGYDTAGNQTSKIDPGGSCTGTVSGCTTMTYDTANQLRSISYSDNPSDNVTIPAYPEGYDANGMRRKMIDKTGTSTWTYDLAGRVIAHQDGAGSLVRYNWDRKSQLTKIFYPGQTIPVTREFDDAGRLFKITDWLGNPTTFGYDANNNIETQTSAAGGESLIDTFGRNDADDLTSIKIEKGPTKVNLATFTYGRDNNGQVGSVNTSGTSPLDFGSPLSDNHTYGYTTLNQLQEVDTGSYSHDAADNLIHTPSGTQQTFDSANQLCWTNGVADPAATCSTGIPAIATRFGYDNRGNRTSKTPAIGSATTYGYDQANRLISATASVTPSATYTYNGDGLRTAKNVGGTTTSFTWDLAQGLPLLLKDGLDAYIYGPGGQPISRISSTNTLTWLHHDQLGSTRLLTDSGGNVSGTFTYDAYGELTSKTGTATTSIRYAGEYTDPETGLIYLRARYYDPTTAQFLSRDPINAVTRDAYGYTGGDPLNGSDPSGLIGFRKFFRDHGAQIAVGVLAVGAIACAATVACGLAVVGAISSVSVTAGNAILVAGTGAGVLGTLAYAAAGAEGPSPSSAAAGLGLERQLASEAQMGEAGTPFAGSGCKDAFRGAADAAAKYGGNAADWVKSSSSGYTDQSGRIFETHWIENLLTGTREELKTKILRR